MGGQFIVATERSSDWLELKCKICKKETRMQNSDTGCDLSASRYAELVKALKDIQHLYFAVQKAGERNEHS